ncbi:hypothetical protein BZG36_04604 [Bifiguratus adelaidae]|uniref:Uncharacterized protein n=1 Tax=Bifiguratus adelaidae TaxID=1938954 RepID=A0A261XXJ3_9FUNG|nr:hypothetical protein BZG36_04604 [Bifiguratus adelaidae]
MHRKMDPPKNEPSEDLRAYINNLALPQPLPCEDEACRLTVRAYGHLISLSKLTSGHNHETSDAVSQLLVQDLWDYRKVGMVPLDVFMGIESALARFYDDLEDELKWGDPNDQLTEQALLECDASYAIRLIMQHFYTLQLWMNIRFLPSDLTKMETPTSATQQFLHHALQRSITAANNLCILAAYSTKYTKNNIDLQLLMLSCEVQYSVAQLGSSSPALSQQAQRHLAMSIAVLKTWFARVHGGNAANYTNKTWDNVAFKQWLKGAGIDYDTLDFDKLLGTYTSGAELISGDSLMALRAKQENTIVLDILEEALVSGFMSMGISDV